MMLPMFQNKKFWFQEQLDETPDMIEAMRQIKYTTYSGFAGHDDFMDTVSQLGMMEIIFPMKGSDTDLYGSRSCS